MQDKIERLRVQLLYEQSLVPQAAGLINVCVFALVIRNAVAEHLAMTWLAGGVGLFTLRTAALAIIRNRIIHKSTDFSPGLWEQVFCISVMISGTYWGVGAAILLSPDMVLYQTFLAFILAGITAGATVAYSSSLMAVASFTMPVLIPFALTLWVEGGEIHKAMAGMILLYAITIMVMVVRVHSYIVSSIRLGFEKDRLMEQLKTTQAASIRSQKMAAIGMLAGGVAHEINTPLATINLKMEEMAKADSAKRQTLAQEVSQTVMRIAKIVNALKAFSHSNIHGSFAPAQISRVIADTVDLCRSQFESHGISVLVQDGPKDCAFMGHPAQISQALLNLMTNSFEALKNSRNGWITIDVQVDEKNIFLSVTDNGCGIKSEIRDKLMQPFFTTKEIGTGPGLGLSAALGIVNEHGGDLHLAEDSEWTKFVITLPRLPTEALRPAV